MTEMVVRLAGGPDHPRLHRPVDRRAARRVEQGRRLRARPARPRKIGVQLGHSGRKGSTKLMWEGMDEPLAEGNWEVVGPSPAPLRRRLPRARARPPAPTWTRSSPTSSPPRGARSTPGFDLHRAARRARLPALLLPLPARQPAHRRVRRLAGEPAALPARGLRRRPRGGAGAHPGDRAHLGDRLDAGRQHRATTPSRSPAPSSSTARPPSTSPPARSPRTRSRRSAAPTRPRSPTGSATRSPRRPGRR